MPSRALPFALLLIPSLAALVQGQRPWEEAARPSERQETSQRKPPAVPPREALLRSASHAKAAASSHTVTAASSPTQPNESASTAPAAAQIVTRGTPPRLPAPGGGQPSSPERSGSAAVATMLASLAIVLGLFFLVMWLLRRNLPAGAAPLPSDVLEVLGRGTIGQKQTVHLVRLGERLLLVAANGQHLETLAEIGDPDEVTRLAGICRQSRPQGATAAFRQVFAQAASPPPRAARSEERRG